MERRTYLRTVAGTALATGTVALAGCSASASTGTLATRVSDQPGAISDFESCVVTIDGVWAKPADGELVREEIEPTDADLVDLQGDRSALVSEVELETGEYSFLQLTIAETTGVLTDGSEVTVEVPGDAPLKFNREFEIRADERTSFTADFTPVRRGGSGSYVLQPVANEVTVSYESTETPTNGTSSTGG